VNTLGHSLDGHIGEGCRYGTAFCDVPEAQVLDAHIAGVASMSGPILTGYKRRSWNPSLVRRPGLRPESY